jgi:hypothetical protein
MQITSKVTGHIYVKHIHDWSLYWLFTSLLHIYMTGPFTGYLQPITHIYMIGPFTGYLHFYYTYTATSQVYV